MRLDLKIAKSCPPPTDSEIAEFERAHGIKIVDEHRWFLQHVANGGYLRSPWEIPTTDCIGGASLWRFIYGINHPEDTLNLASQLAVQRNWESAFNDPFPGRFLPFGGDDVGGEVLIDITVNIGQVVYNPRDPYEFCFSAESIRQFLDHLIPERCD